MAHGGRHRSAQGSESYPRADSVESLSCADVALDVIPGWTAVRANLRSVPSPISEIPRILHGREGWCAPAHSIPGEVQLLPKGVKPMSIFSFEHREIDYGGPSTKTECHLETRSIGGVEFRAYRCTTDGRLSPRAKYPRRRGACGARPAMRGCGSVGERSPGPRKGDARLGCGNCPSARNGGSRGLLSGSPGGASPSRSSGAATSPGDLTEPTTSRRRASPNRARVHQTRTRARRRSRGGRGAADEDPAVAARRVGWSPLAGNFASIPEEGSMVFSRRSGNGYPRVIRSKN